MIVFFINDNPKSASYKCKKNKLLEKPWWYLGNIKIYTERNLSVLVELLQISKEQHLFITSISEFEDYTPTEICQFILRVVDNDLIVHFVDDNFYFHKSNIADVYEVVFKRYKELNPIIKGS